MTSPGDTAPKISLATGVLSAWIIAGIGNAFALATALPRPPRLELRAIHLLLDTGHFITLGLVFAGLCGLVARASTRRTRAVVIAAIAVGTCALGAAILPADLANMSERIGTRYGPITIRALLVGSVSGVIATIPVAYGIGKLLARPHLRWLGVAAGFAIFATHALVLPNSYHGIHLFITFAAALLIGTSFAGTTVAPVLRRPLKVFSRPTVRTACFALLAAWGAVSIVRRPPVLIGADYTVSDTSVLAHFVTRFHPPHTPLHTAEIPAEMKPWFVDRKNHPPIAPTEPPLLPENPVVVLITIDCTRADVVLSGKYDDKLPALARLRQSSTTFQNARSAAAGTSISLMSIFTGTYFSQQYWNKILLSTGPQDDTSIRLGEILSQSNVATVTFSGLGPGLMPPGGTMRGFTEATNLQTDASYVSADKLMDAALNRLTIADDRALFLFVHFLDAHAPYTRGIQTGSSFDRYLSELQLVDQQINRLHVKLNSSSLRHRALLIVTADHGEAFGEHGINFHSANLYEELVRVPLLMWRPGKPPINVDEPVSLIDLTPTIVDLFHLPTPGHFMGQSLVPFLLGQKPKLHRPILAEARLKQSLVLPDGYKVIVDNRLNTVELYDLRTDPAEKLSIADDEERLSRPLSLLRQFYEVQTIRKPGYSPPYRHW